MHQTLEAIKTTRISFSYLLEKLPLDMLNTIPQGFRNNIVWNAGHCLAVGQSLVYGISDTPFREDMNILKEFLPGTQPKNYKQDEVNFLIERLRTSTRELEEDYINNIFGTFKTFKSKTRYEINDIESALTFDLFHEGYHMGIAVTMMKSLT